MCCLSHLAVMNYRQGFNCFPVLYLMTIRSPFDMIILSPFWDNLTSLMALGMSFLDIILHVIHEHEVLNYAKTEPVSGFIDKNCCLVFWNSVMVLKLHMCPYLVIWCTFDPQIFRYTQSKWIFSINISCHLVHWMDWWIPNCNFAYIWSCCELGLRPLDFKF